MWTKKGVVVLCGGIAILFTALLVRSMQLVMTSIAIFSYLLFSVFATRLSRVIPVRKVSSEKIFEDGEITAELELINRGSRTGFLEVRDKIPRQVDLKEGSNYIIVDLAGGETTTMRYRFVAPLRGIYPIGPIMLRSQDNFGLFYKELSIEDINMISVFPRIEEIKEIYVKARSMKLYPGASPVKMPGPGSEFFLIRDYIPGDPFKNINWKAFARTGKLLVNEKEREAVSDIIFIVDSSSESNYGTEAENPLMYGARAAATMAHFFLKRRDSVGLIVYGEKLVTIKQGMGQKQLYEVLTGLAGAVAEGNLPFKGVVDVVAPYLPKRSPVIIISSLDGDETIPDGISTLRVLEYPIIVLSPSSIEFELMARAKTRLGIGDPMPYEILKLVREIKLADIRALGAHVIDWDPKTPLLAVLRETKR
ncbi:MAG: DUF58 domain-containing protein [Candidatus Thermoplasmatota archaeon]